MGHLWVYSTPGVTNFYKLRAMFEGTGLKRRMQKIFTDQQLDV